MDEQPSEYEKLEENMGQLMAMLYDAVDKLPEEDRESVLQGVADIKKRAAQLGDRAGLALNIALYESRGNGFN